MKFYFLFVLFIFTFSSLILAQKVRDTLLAVPQYHILQASENITVIAQLYKIEISQILVWNKLEAGDKLPKQLIIGYTYHQNFLPIKTQPDLDSIHHNVLLDSVRKKIDKMLDVSFEERFMLFNAGLRRDSLNRSLIISGYVDAYYGFYTDSVGTDAFQKFPTVAPKSNAFGINIVQLSARYSSEKVRGIFTLHYGDIPKSAWSPVMNFFQEANIGFKLFQNTWFDVGFFRTHLGCESIQPRENINVGVALTTFYDPYFLSGIKLSHRLNNKLMLQVNMFNSYNSFVQVNKHKTYGFTAIAEPNDKILLSYNVLFSNETSDSSAVNKFRTYQDFFLIYKNKRWEGALELNFGTQTHSRLDGKNALSTVCSGSLIAKRKFSNKTGLFGRFEFYQDDNDILSGPIYNEQHQFVGLDIVGFTFGG